MTHEEMDAELAALPDEVKALVLRMAKCYAESSKQLGDLGELAFLLAARSLRLKFNYGVADLRAVKDEEGGSGH